ncbi:MAG: HEAT repeat domain-containing protein, partial [Pyrinomonadaceae bacterium]
VARDQAASEIERLKEEHAALETAQRAEAEGLRRKAERKNGEAQQQLRVELEGLHQAEEEVAKRRAEVEAAREKADAEAHRLVEAQARMQAAEEARAQAEIERSQLEAEINRQVETQMQLLEETRRRGQEEQERLQEEIRLRTGKEHQRLTELEVMKTKAEVESKQRAEKEQQILNQIDSLRIADAETRRRIEDADTRRRAAEDAYRLIAEKVQRVEAEAHARAKEEERMLARLESERRNAAIEAQSRAEQEKRIREEIEMFRRLEEEERPRVEEATLQLAEAEARLQERKDRLKEDSEARVLAEEELTKVGEYQHISAEQAGAAEWQESVAEKPAPMPPDESARLIAKSAAAGPEEGAEHVVANYVDDADSTDEIATSAVTPAIATYLNSVDPYKRAAAVAELARSGSPDAFVRIADCFDDHSPHVRNAAARALRRLEPDKAVDLFNRALERASAERRRNIGAAIAASGLATEAINNLAGESREDTYNALSILFVMAKTGEVAPLERALEEHRDDEIGKAVLKLLTLSGHKIAEQAVGADGSSSAQ